MNIKTLMSKLPGNYELLGFFDESEWFEYIKSSLMMRYETRINEDFLYFNEEYKYIYLNFLIN